MGRAPSPLCGVLQWGAPATPKLDGIKLLQAEVRARTIVGSQNRPWVHFEVRRI